MTNIDKDWRTVLIEAHPRLFNLSGERPDQTRGYPECGDGWNDLLTRLCDRIDAALMPGETIQVAQIKEKFAGLRFYWHGEVSAETVAAIQEAIDLAEARSLCSCEECGEEGSLYRHGGTLMTRCDFHAKGRPVPLEPGMENVHIVRRAVGDGFQKVARHYDRATDTLTEIDPTSFESEG